VVVKKLYIVVRADLKPQGAIAPQAVHACATFARRHREVFDVWHDGPNNVVILAARDENHLARLQATIESLALLVGVREPDLGDSLTAIAFSGTDAAARLVSSLPLALRELTEGKGASTLRAQNCTA